MNIDDWFFEHSLKILVEFDFEKVHNVMTYLNWSWDLDGEIPSISEIKTFAGNLLKNAYEMEDIVSSGGFSAQFSKQEKYLSLAFIVESFESF